MRLYQLLYLSCLALVVPIGLAIPAENGLVPRQGVTNTNLPSVPASGGNTLPSATSASPSASTRASASGSSGSGSASGSGQPSASPSASGSIIASIGSNSTSSSTSIPTPTPSIPSNNATATNGTTVVPDTSVQLPIQPRITPAFGIGGVILIITGIAYGLIGVKNRYIQIFLSTAYLCSLSVCVLIDYVMSPPVSDAIQGAYFVGIFMTGLIFGAGALIFKEVTEGLGCILGGFCLAMWFLTLKEGGLITNTTGKAILIAVFCVIAWSLSFSRYTRAYALIGSTSFSGATAFVLGVDCFSLGGLKEFWFYVWALNPNLFPLNTTTYPITRGTRVETIVIILGCIVGIMSQIKLWKIVRDRQKKKDAEKIEEERRREVVETALGRHIQRRNDRDRAEWEKQYGDRLTSKRNTILWSEAHPDKRHTNISVAEFQTNSSSSSDSLEMTAFGPRKPASTYSSKNKRQSTMAVDVIPEVEEDQEPNAEKEREKALAALEDDAKSARSAKTNQTSNTTETVSMVEGMESKLEGPKVIPLPFRVPTGDSRSQTGHPPSPRELTIPDSALKPPRPVSKRRSLQSLLSLSPRLSTEIPTSESQEALVIPSSRLSLASSLAATLDEENDKFDGTSLRSPYSEPPTPKIIISPVASLENLSKAKSRESMASIRPPSPPALDASFDFDPEELTRPPTSVGLAPKSASKSAQPNKSKTELKEKEPSTPTAPESEDPSRYSNSYAKSQTSQSTNDGLTKGALDQVPSQVSNVVLSYRTNEWAKHISTAEAPVYDEPQTINDDENVVDLPTQLADPSLATANHPIIPPPELPITTSPTRMSPVPSPSPTIGPKEGESISTIPQTSSKLVSDQRVPGPSTDMPSRSGSSMSNRGVPKQMLRSTSTPMVSKQSLIGSPIDENTTMDFGRVPAVRQNTFNTMPTRSPSHTSYTPTNGLGSGRISASTNALVDSTYRSSSQMSFRERPVEPIRSMSQLSNRVGMRSDTRLDTYESRQPPKRELATEAEKREILLAEWRMSQQQGANTAILPKTNIDSRRAQMMMDKEQKRMMEEQQRYALQQKQFAIDQVMRRPDMQDLHREALRKMQAGANKAL